MLAMRQARIPGNDPRLLLDELRTRGVAGDMATPQFWARLLKDRPYEASAAAIHAERLRGLAVRRRQQAAIIDGYNKIVDETNAPEDVSDWLKSELDAATYTEQTGMEAVDAVAARVVDAIKHPPARGRTLMSGLRSHDSIVGGWAAGELVILAARPGVGKTSLAMQIAAYNAQRGRGCLFVSLEMSSDALTKRLLKGDRGPLDARIAEEAELFADRLTSDEARAAFMAFMARKGS